MFIAFTTATSIDISYIEPLFFVLAGARFTITAEGGIFIRQAFRAERILSLLSFTAVSGSPTILNDGSPRLISISTSTGNTSKPLRPRLFIFANIIFYLR